VKKSTKEWGGGYDLSEWTKGAHPQQNEGKSPRGREAKKCPSYKKTKIGPSGRGRLRLTKFLKKEEEGVRFEK